MESQSRIFSKRHIGVRLHGDRLPRRETRHRHLVEVVGRAAVREFATLRLLKVDGIKPIVHHTLLNVLRVIHVQHTD